MNVSTKSEYGLRALIYLASHNRSEAIPAREIAEQWHVPIKYLEQILKTLKEGGLIESQLGLGGGYRLTRPATLITAGEVIRLLDGRLSPVGCVSTYDYEPCEFEPACGLKCSGPERAPPSSACSTKPPSQIYVPPPTTTTWLASPPLPGDKPEHQYRNHLCKSFEMKS